MKKSNVLIIVMLALFSIGCSKDDDTSTPDDTSPPAPRGDLKVTLSGLGMLSDNYMYEGWIMVNGNPVSTGKFNTDGSSTDLIFSVLKSDLEVASAFVVSIELANDDSIEEPSSTKILMGTFAAKAATLKIDSVVGNFITNPPFKGTFINITPSDDANGINNFNDDFGVWFVENDRITPGLKNLPTLAAGWKYEGWVIFPGPTPVTTGKFTMASGPDASSPYSGNWPVPLFPGEDLVQDLPGGVTGDITDLEVVISIEPNFSSDPNTPFFLKPISGQQGVNDNELLISTNINATITGLAQIL